MSKRGTLALAVAALTASLGVSPVEAQAVAPSKAAPRIYVLAGSGDANTVIEPPALTRDSRSATAQVSYSSSVFGEPFPAAAQAAVQAAVNIWTGLLSSSVPITIQANWRHFSADVLAGAGPSFVYKDFDNAPVAGTYYASALAEALAGHSFSGSDPDVVVDINNRSDWSYRTDGTPVPGQFDLESVVLHELAHGWGFLGTMDVSGGQGQWGVTGDPDTPDIYDRFSQDSAGAALLSYPNRSTALGNALQSNGVYFSSQKTNQGPSDRIKLYAPNPWLGGSSFAHLDEATYPAGTPDSLLTPFLSRAEVIHSPGPKTLCLLEALGWSTPQACSPAKATLVQGFTWYSDGSSTKSGPAGTSITAFATGAANGSYKLVTGHSGSPDQPCMFDTVAVNPNVRVANSRGFISNTSGPVNRPPGDWEVCFRQEGTGSTLRVTLPLTFTVTG